MVLYKNNRSHSSAVSHFTSSQNSSEELNEKPFFRQTLWKEKLRGPERDGDGEEEEGGR